MLIPLLVLGDCDSAPESTGPPIPSKQDHILRRHGPVEGRRGLGPGAIAWPGEAVIASPPTHALLQLVRSGTDGEPAPGFRNAWASSTLSASDPDAVQIAQSEQ